MKYIRIYAYERAFRELTIRVPDDFDTGDYSAAGELFTRHSEHADYHETLELTVNDVREVKP